MARLKAAKVSSPGSTANAMIAAKTVARTVPIMKRHGGRVGLVGSRRKQEHHDRGEGDGERAVRPCGHDPEELDGADRDERAPRIDERRQPIGHAEPDSRGREERAEQDRRRAAPAR